VLGVAVRVLLGFQRHHARRYRIRDRRSGSVTVIQRFGAGLNLKRLAALLSVSGAPSQYSQL
jgi:hypothetical protein